jgi:hypothetical protein
MSCKFRNILHECYKTRSNLTTIKLNCQSQIWPTQSLTLRMITKFVTLLCCNIYKTARTIYNFSCNWFYKNTLKIWYIVERNTHVDGTVTCRWLRISYLIIPTVYNSVNCRMLVYWRAVYDTEDTTRTTVLYKFFFYSWSISLHFVPLQLCAWGWYQTESFTTRMFHVAVFLLY